MTGCFDLAPWAEQVMASRSPDFVIGDDYLRRWWIVPRNKQANVYLHMIRNSDDDRALHDHPWDSTSVIISGGYIEHTPEGSFARVSGDVITRKAEDAHRLEIVAGQPAVTLFLTGPNIREWGFHCPNGWRVWTEFVDARDKGQIGRGCA